ncbi:MAG: hypothetical protein WKF77_27225 [Planctomycetaceae bacterium]
MPVLQESCVVSVIPSYTGSTVMFGSGLMAEFRVTEIAGELRCSQSEEVRHLTENDVFNEVLIDAASSEIKEKAREAFADLLKSRGLQVTFLTINIHITDSNPYAFRRIGARLAKDACENLWQS